MSGGDTPRGSSDGSPGRHRPPNRRPGLSREVTFGNRPVTITVGFDPATVAASLGREGHIVDPAAPAPPASLLGLLARIALDAQTELDSAAGALTQAFEDRGDPGPNAEGSA